MRVIEFTDEYQAVADLYGTSEDRLRRRDAAPQPRRWVAADDTSIVGVVTATTRPDTRSFLRFAGSTETFAALAEAAASSVRPVYATVDAAEAVQLSCLQRAGFAIELTVERFEIAFAAAFGALPRTWAPSWMALMPADTVDVDGLVALDDRLRNDVPGIGRWQGTVADMAEELAERPPFDPAAYLVGSDKRSDELIGLVRIWRNPSGPRLGLIGVLPAYRGGVVAAALLRPALEAASDWGHESFVTEMSPSNDRAYPALRRLGAEPVGAYHQLVCRSR